MKTGTFIKLAAFATGICGVASAGQVNLGFIGVYAGLGAASDYQIVVLSNQSSLGPCDQATAYALSCDAVSLFNWSLEVDYTALIGGVQVPQAPVYNSSVTCGVTGCDTIGSNNDWVNSPLYALPYSVTNPNSDTLVTRLIFAGSIASPISIWNPGDTAPSTFFPQSPFTVTVDIPADDDYTLGNAPYYITDLLIDDAGAGAGPGVPEPASLVLTLAGVMGLITRHRLKRN